MGFWSPDPPPATDYLSAAQAQGQANLDAATSTSRLNNPNVVSPYGTQTYYQGNPTDPAAYEQQLRSQLEAAKQGVPVWGVNYESYQAEPGPNQSERTAARFNNMLSTANQKVSDAQRALDEYLKTGMVPMDPSRPTMVQSFSPEQQALYDRSMQTKRLLGDLGIQGANALFGVVGKQLDLNSLPGAPGSATDTRGKVIDAMMSRVNEDTARQRDDLHSNLVAAGLRPGSKAYDDRMALVDRQYNDARNQAFLASGQEASRDFSMDSQRRAQALSDVLTSRQTPLNEINALLSGSQVSNPFSLPGYAQNAQVGAAPVFAAQNALSDYNTDVFNAKAAQQGQLVQGLFGLGGAGLQGAGAAGGFGTLFSDRRLKTNIQRVGTHPLGVGWYEYDMFGRRQQGVMADEVREVKPEAVLEHASGYLMVDYDRL